VNFSIEKEVFLKGLSKIQGIVEKRSTIPILSNVLIETNKTNIYLTATDLEVGMRASYPATINQPGKITVSAKKIYEIVKELPEKEITFKSKDNSWIEISCGKSLFNIVGLSSDEFPHFPDINDNNMIPVNGNILNEMIEKTLFSISNDDTKYNLNGIYFKKIKDNEKSALRLVATDGHRLALIQRKMEIPDIEELDQGIILPRKGINELKKIAEDSEENILIGFIDNSFVIKKENTIVVMRLVNGDFPDYNRVIPKNNEDIAIINRDLFLHVLKRMSILLSEKSKGVKIEIKNNKIEISSSNPDLGDAREEMEINYSGPEIVIGLNARYMIDIIQALDCEKIKLAVKDNMSPGLITPEIEDGFLSVIMPMRL